VLVAGDSVSMADGDDEAERRPGPEVDEIAASHVGEAEPREGDRGRGHGGRLPRHGGPT